ncbi:hypothetical protein DL768_004940 [Monosporascus sp. mg162]|nr:hypothetical protein DL768_004940 [Monosporascus sp. mg162]
MDSFTYRPLPPSEYIRVLELLPPAFNQLSTDRNPSDIRCKIEHVALEDEPQYDALSYCWGDPTQSIREIICDGTLLVITENLYCALTRLREETVSVRLWVDAVCINQVDQVEKATQIPLMGDIYKNSEHVLIWLGEEAPEDEGSLEFARFLETESYRDRTPIQDQFVWAFRRARHVPPPHDEKWKKFFALFKRPWFSRLWIIQEVAVARNPVVACGSSRISWDALLKALRYSGMLGIESFYYNAINLNGVYDLQNCRKQYLEGTPSSLSKLLTRTQQAAATNPLDKIYGLWAIADRSNIAQLSITPSYKIPVENLYRDVAVHTLRTSRSLDLFWGLRCRDRSNLHLPSWVPDWTLTESFVTLRHQELAFPDCMVPEWQSQHFHSTGDSRASPAFTVDGNLLGLRGHIIGTVDEVSCTLRLEPGPASMYDVQQDLRDWERVAGARSAVGYRTGEHILNCYWQTLCAGVMPGGYQVCQEEFRRFDAVTRTLQSFADLSRYGRSLINVFPWLKLGVSISALVFHACFRSFTVIEDIRGFQGNNGAMIGRRMARTDTGYISLVPEETEEGDSIVLLEGGKAPLVVRPDKSGPQKKEISKLTRWEILGETYVHGAMNGEAFQPDECRRFWFS